MNDGAVGQWRGSLKTCYAVSGCLLFAIRRVRRFIARSVENLCPLMQPEIRPQTVDAAAGCRGLPLLVAGGETPARAKDWDV
ncbi:hypothetical protein [Kingella oralis]